MGKTSTASKLRDIFWPIHGIEHKKFLPLAFMMFCILFNYSMLRSIKDGFVVTAIGAEALGFLKMYVVLPSAIVAMIAYSSLCNVMAQQRVFYAVAGFFVSYIAVFTFILFPNVETFNINPETISAWCESFPRFKWFIKIAGNWPYSTFYVMAELWGSMMLSLLFWQFANQITKAEEAKRFYSMFGLLGNLGLPLTGFFLGHYLGKDATGDAQTNFMIVLSITIVSGILVILTYAWANANVLTDERLYDPNSKQASKKKKTKLSLKESFELIFSSKYLGLIAVLVLAYGISINLVEGVWKNQVKLLYPTKEAYTSFMGQFQAWQGIAAIIFMLIGSNILRLFSWTTAAILTPIMILITGSLFFFFIVSSGNDSSMIGALLISDPLVLAVTIGMIQNVLSKATKYSLFDSTQKMAYMPLDEELKTKGMAAVEVVGGRLGKSGGGFIQSTTFLLFPAFGFAEATPIFGLICTGIVVAWIYAVKALGKEYTNAMKDHSY
jgi:AAA family ATP:ADP antiporter